MTNIRLVLYILRKCSFEEKKKEKNAHGFLSLFFMFIPSFPAYFIHCNIIFPSGWILLNCIEIGKKCCIYFSYSDLFTLNSWTNEKIAIFGRTKKATLKCTPIKLFNIRATCWLGCVQMIFYTEN